MSVAVFISIPSFGLIGIRHVPCGGGKPGLAPAGELLSFASPKASNQRKGEPTAGPLRGAEFLGSEPKFAEPFGSPCGSDAPRRSEIGV
jgi:hypothetical protein